MGRAICAIIVLVVGAASGFLIGQSKAPTESEAAQVRAEAMTRSLKSSYFSARANSVPKGLKRGAESGTKLARRTGGSQGANAGADAAQSEIEAAAAADAAEAAAQLEYTDQLPNNNPGYLLPEGERTLGCVGYDAYTGECVGD